MDKRSSIGSIGYERPIVAGTQGVTMESYVVRYGMGHLRSLGPSPHTKQGEGLKGTLRNWVRMGNLRSSLMDPLIDPLIDPLMDKK